MNHTEDQRSDTHLIIHHSNADSNVESKAESIAANPATPDNVLIVAGEIDQEHPFTELRLPNGEVLRLPTSLLISSTSSPASDISAETSPGVATGLLTNPIERDGVTVIPLIEERLEVSRRTISTGKVRLHKTVQEYQESLDEPLAVRTFDIERIILNHPIDTAPPVRHEGDTTIYPLVEEQLVLTKQLILKEEVRVTQRDAVRRDTQVVTLRREHISVERERL